MSDTTQEQLVARQRVDVLAASETPFRVRLRRIKAAFVNGFQELLKSRTATIGALMVTALLLLVIFWQKEVESCTRNSSEELIWFDLMPLLLIGSLKMQVQLEMQTETSSQFQHLHCYLTLTCNKILGTKNPILI